MPTRKPILCLDFDGVIHSYTSKWEASDIIPDPPVEGALEFLEEATEHFRVCIYSTRSNTDIGRLAMMRWLTKWAGEGTDETNWFRQIEWPLTKPSALVTLDDRALTFEGDWPSMETLLKFKPWNKRG